MAILTLLWCNVVSERCSGAHIIQSCNEICRVTIMKRKNMKEKEWRALLWNTETHAWPSNDEDSHFSLFSSACIRHCKASNIWIMMIFCMLRELLCRRFALKFEWAWTESINSVALLMIHERPANILYAYEWISEKKDDGMRMERWGGVELGWEERGRNE